MSSETIKDLMPQTPDLNDERKAKLKELFPDLFTDEGGLNENELRKLVDPQGVNETERYEFSWFGKSRAKREAFTPGKATLAFDVSRSVNPLDAGNLIVEGENLEVLKLLLCAYRESIKCIYIDPPYNTGKDFVYSDNYTEERQPYWEQTGVTEAGVRVDTNAETDGRYHSNWMNMMFSRLLVARQLLKPDGVIFISIGDDEVHNLRRLCNEVFGEENFEGHIHWRRRYNQPNDRTKMIGLVAEHILSYSKNKEEYKKSGVGKIDLTGDFSNPDNDARGEWASKPWKVGSDQSGSRYKITNPFNNKVYDEEWMGDEKTYEKLSRDNRIVFPKRGEGLPRKKYFRFEREEEGQCATNWWSHDEFGHNQGANDEMTSLFETKNVFSNPKPTELIKGLIKISNAKENDLIVDFFSGSGVTGQAVIELNEEDGGNRKFILVQLPELIDEKSEAYKAGYRRISDITIERNKRVVASLIAARHQTHPQLFENPTNAKGALDGLGFKVYRLEKSYFPRTDWTPDAAKSEAENVHALKQYIADKESQLSLTFDREKLLTEILLKEGFKLNYTIAPYEAVSSNDILRASDADREALVCLDETLELNTIEHFKTHAELKFICLERALDTTKKWNLHHFLGEKFKAV